jgi:serine/threonine-protein kinase
MLTKSGAKLLDFGLAKLREPGGDEGIDTDSALPTQARPLTEEGKIVGTYPYMAPEQLEGEKADARTDIFAFGAVLYEMVTGKRAFEGKSRASLIAAILSSDPRPISELQPMTPPLLDRIVKRCLAKDPDERWQSAGDLTAELRWIAEGVVEAGVTPSPAAAAWRRQRLMLVGGVVILLVALALALIEGFAGGRGRPEATITRFRIDLEQPNALFTDVGPAVVLSPSGDRLVYVAGTPPDTRLFVRALQSTETTPLSGTEGAVNPFFSPDGQEVAFFAGGQLKRVSVSGGQVRTLCDANPGANRTPLHLSTLTRATGSWGNRGVIVFSPATSGPLFAVPSSGGEPIEATRLDTARGEVLHRWPQLLPDGEHVLFASATRQNDFENATILVQSLGSGERKELVRGAYFGRYIPSGHLVFMRRGTLLATPFDPSRLELSGTPVTAIESVLADPYFGGAQISFSAKGSLLYATGSVPERRYSLVWADRGGRLEPLLETARPYGSLRFSPDGRHLAFYVGGRHYSRTGESDVWLHDLERGVTTRFTTDPAPDFSPIWTPDGQWLTFSSRRGGGASNLFRKRADGSAEAQRLTVSEYSQWPHSWSPDGRVLLFNQASERPDMDIWSLRLDDAGRPGQPQPLIDTPYYEKRPAFSPDGRWLGYISNESGTWQVYVRPFPEAGGKWQISSETESISNLCVRWSRSSQELFYRPVPGRMMVVSYSVDGDTFRAERPRLLFQAPLDDGSWPDWDVTPDGQRFVALQSAGEAEIVPYEAFFVTNWFDELRQLVPTED